MSVVKVTEISREANKDDPPRWQYQDQRSLVLSSFLRLPPKQQEVNAKS